MNGKPGVLAELATMRKRFVACAMHSGSDKEFAEGACESFDKASATVAELFEVAEAIKTRVEKGIKNSGEYKFMTEEAGVQYDRLCAALAAFNGEQS